MSSRFSLLGKKAIKANLMLHYLSEYTLTFIRVACTWIKTNNKWEVDILGWLNTWLCGNTCQLLPIFSMRQNFVALGSWSLL